MTGFRKITRTLKTLWPALEAGRPTAVHEVRKLTRRAQAQLEVARASKRDRRAWRRLRRAVAAVRDRDVAGQHLAQALSALDAPPEVIQAFTRAWAENRARQFTAVALPKPPPAVHRPRRWKNRVRTALKRYARHLLQEAAEVLGSGEVAPWHRWRKHLKRYRSVLELTGVAPAPLRQVLKALGRMQDAQVAQELLNREAWLPPYRSALLRWEAEAWRSAQTQVRETWPALAEHLQRQAGNRRSSAERQISL